MKKFVLFLLVVGGLGAAGFFFYDPHLKPYLGPLVEKITGAVDSAIGDDDSKIVKGGGKTEPAPVKVKVNSSKTVPDKLVTKTDIPAPAPKKEAPPMSKIDQIVAKKYPMPEIRPLLEIVDNWNNVPRNAYPRVVAIKEKLAFSMTINGNKMASVAAPGTEVAPTRIQGSTLYITSLANKSMTNQIQIDKTDFKDRVTKRYVDFVNFKRTQTQTAREKAKKALSANSEKLASLVANEGKWDKTGDPRFGPVKASIAGGKVQGVTMEEATTFRWNGSERVGGEMAGSYDTVTVHFEVSTIFGRFPADYKCLLRGGRVVGWIDPISDEKL